MPNLEKGHDGLLQLGLADRVLAGEHAHLSYTVYGYQAADKERSVMRFNGQAVEPLTKGYLLGNGYRLFQPGICRFHSPDDLSPFGAGGLNCYAYCSGDPINNIDPSGRVKELSALIAKHGLNKPRATQALKAMPIPETKTHVSVARYAEPNVPPLTVFRNSQGGFSAIVRADPENVALKAQILDGLRSILLLADTVLFYSKHTVRNTKLLSGGRVLAKTAQTQNTGPNYSENAVKPKNILGGASVLVRDVRQEAENP
ncbi:RHS repeat-associated core domain-containing protein [Pseudomonas alloputida]|uniref:RHS repeat-associated core domain-containing protein n=1 Tax=Pseudomonas TaxID=286 RepID=UPI003EE9E6B9